MSKLSTAGEPRRPDFHQLETFLKVAESRSFADAARRLGITQPAVSQTIARLEEIFGGDLFERRRGAPVALTPIGRAILPKARLLLFTVDQQINRAVATAQSRSGTLALGLYTGIGRGTLSKAIAAFKQSRPHVHLRITESSPAELYRQLNERSLDIIFTAFLGQISGSVNQQEPLWIEPICVALEDHHPLAGRADLHWTDLATMPLIIASAEGDLSAYRAIAARMGDRMYHCDLHDVSHGCLIDMVRLGFGPAITLASCCVPLAGIAFVPVIDENSRVHVEAIWPKADRNPLRHRLLSLVREFAGEA